jgi:type II secretory pathway pseudopilin PulG
MQRKNSLLKKSSHRDGMAMIMAIAVIVIIATIMALSLRLTTQTSKKTTDLYLYEQAAILSHSAAEYAMLKMSQANPCSIATINYTYNTTYDINTSMLYISTAGSTCESNATAIGRNYGTTAHPTSNGTVIIDVSVMTNQGTEPIRYFRRSIQKL